MKKTVRIVFYLFEKKEGFSADTKIYKAACNEIWSCLYNQPHPIAFCDGVEKSRLCDIFSGIISSLSHQEALKISKHFEQKQDNSAEFAQAKELVGHYLVEVA